MAILFGVLTLMGGREWWLLAAAMAGAGVALFGVAAGLWGLRRRLPSRGLRWTIMHLGIQAVLIPAGWILMGLGESAQPASGTEGPFVDGATGWMAFGGIHLRLRWRGSGGCDHLGLSTAQVPLRLS